MYSKVAKLIGCYIISMGLLLISSCSGVWSKNEGQLVIFNISVYTVNIYNCPKCHDFTEEMSRAFNLKSDS